MRAGVTARPSRSGVVSLVLLNLALGGLAYVAATGDLVALMSPSRDGSLAGAGSAGVGAIAPPLAPVEVPSAPTLNEIGETLKRPLFRADRRPYVAPPPAPAPVPQVVAAAPVAPPLPPPNVKLAGIVTAGGTARALLRTPTEASGTWKRAGDVVDGWRLDRIGLSDIEFVVGQRRIVVRLEPPSPADRRTETGR